MPRPGLCFRRPSNSYPCLVLLYLWLLNGSKAATRSKGRCHKEPPLDLVVQRNALSSKRGREQNGRKTVRGSLRVRRPEISLHSRRTKTPRAGIAALCWRPVASAQSTQAQGPVNSSGLVVDQYSWSQMGHFARKEIKSRGFPQCYSWNDGPLFQKHQIFLAVSPETSC